MTSLKNLKSSIWGLIRHQKDEKSVPQQQPFPTRTSMSHFRTQNVLMKTSAGVNQGAIFLWAD